MFSGFNKSEMKCSRILVRVAFLTTVCHCMLLAQHTVNYLNQVNCAGVAQSAI